MKARKQVEATLKIVGTISFGVSRRNNSSTPTKTNIAMITAKSLIKHRTLKQKSTVNN